MSKIEKVLDLLSKICLLVIDGTAIGLLPPVSTIAYSARYTGADG